MTPLPPLRADPNDIKLTLMTLMTVMQGRQGGMGWLKVTVGAVSVWSEPSGCTYSNTAAIAERSKLVRPTLIPGAFFAFLRTRVYNRQREGCCLHSPGALLRVWE